ncbi:PREDICTED: uncharacterized protein LOC104717517 [Camelina sativa]|uniref:Uncharacterized protein LOC104717517 n=1 Tax=Camelina sativa TaxID=90675 RepID=A0ABM0TYV2_CAMSA|nr:PREDICTED: uncharacterized protein LOC104717517 [Camelina sativa]XP_019086398.1 PREDICTED: uncharacterized protein LOC104717517 [Camelina sativa]
MILFTQGILGNIFDGVQEAFEDYYPVMCASLRVIFIPFSLLFLVEPVPFLVLLPVGNCYQSGTFQVSPPGGDFSDPVTSAWYKDRPMYVRYTNEDNETEGDGIFRLVAFDVETKSCIWGIADIRVNREKASKENGDSKWLSSHYG